MEIALLKYVLLKGTSSTRLGFESKRKRLHSLVETTARRRLIGRRPAPIRTRPSLRHRNDIVVLNSLR
jgi:hypothetical protein